MWYGPFSMVRVLSYVSMEFKRYSEAPLNVSVQRVKYYMENTEEVKAINEFSLCEI